MTSKLVLGLAVGTSAAVGTAAVVGNGLTTPEVVGALAAAGAIGILNLRQNRPQARPHVLSDLPDGSGEAVIAAPRARSLMAHPAGRGAAATAGHADAA